MTPETTKNKQSKTRQRRLTFKCKLCGKTRPLSEFKVLTRFFPAVAACRDCEKAME